MLVSDKKGVGSPADNFRHIDIRQERQGGARGGGRRRLKLTAT